MLKPELLENNFQNLNIFQVEFLNKYCDLITHRVKQITGEEICLVGSVAKILHGEISAENYVIKDIDFIVTLSAFQKLIKFKKEILPEAYTLEQRPERLIFYMPNFAIEIWNHKERNTDKQKLYFNNKIPYLYAN